MPALDSRAVNEQRLAVQRGAVADALAREDRVLRLAWPILTANAELCTKTAPALGMRLGDAKTIGVLAEGLRKEQVEALGYDETVRVLSIAPGGPAANAGLRPGDVVTAVGAENVEGLRETGEALDKVLGKQDPAPVTLSIARGAEMFEATLEPVEACDVRVVSSPKNAINAKASFKTMTVYAGLLRAVEDDNALSFIIAHELAHVAGRHPRKVIRNAGVTGTVLWAPPLVIAGQVLDIVARPVAKGLGAEAAPFTTLTTRAAAGAVRSADFEREADYVGLYMLARAGGAPEGVGDVFQLFANVSPLSSWILVSHPTVPERQLRLDLAAAEISRKRKAGAPLLPEGWTTD
ncbi:hypothetical protein GCM10007148_08210 [Parvularcula lutaonensis]|nr:hypothetical protein GCM10007148_08210 [Parvularcula lutaonensis]